MKNYFIKKGYSYNPNPVQYQDTAENALIYQVDVYRYAAQKILELELKRVLDVGCGLGLKLEKYILPTGAEITGVDLDETIKVCMSQHSFGHWVADNIECPHADLGQFFDLIICADVIEHLHNPDILFQYFKRWSSKDTKIILSTPERNLRRGSDHMGPPGNGAHVREWNAEEFQQYVQSQQLTIEDHRIVELATGMKCCQMIICSWLAKGKATD